MSRSLWGCFSTFSFPCTLGVPKGSSISIKEPSIFRARIFLFGVVFDGEADGDEEGGIEEEEGNGAFVKDDEGEVKGPFEDEFEEAVETDGFDDVKDDFDSVEPSICLPTPEKLRVEGEGEEEEEEDENDECKLLGSDFSFLLLAASANRFIF